MTEGLTIRYNTDPQFAIYARMLVALAFVPETDVDQVFTTLTTHPSFPTELYPVADYFEDTYLGRTSRGRRRQPIFSVSVWSVYTRTLLGLDRTNNYAEAAHRTLQRFYGTSHPTIWKFIDGLKQTQKLRDAQVAAFTTGLNPTQKRTKYQLCDERIANIVSTYDVRDPIEYLRGLASNFLME